MFQATHSVLLLYKHSSKPFLPAKYQTLPSRYSLTNFKLVPNAWIGYSIYQGNIVIHWKSTQGCKFYNFWMNIYILLNSIELTHFRDCSAIHCIIDFESHSQRFLWRIWYKQFLRCRKLVKWLQNRRGYRFNLYIHTLYNKKRRQ